MHKFKSVKFIPLSIELSKHEFINGVSAWHYAGIYDYIRFTEQTIEQNPELFEVKMEFEHRAYYKAKYNKTDNIEIIQYNEKGYFTRSGVSKEYRENEFYKIGKKIDFIQVSLNQLDI